MLSFNKLKNKIAVRMTGILVSFFLAASSVLMPVLEVQAAAAGAALTAWEILQMLLLSAGVTIEVYNGVSTLSDDEAYSTALNLFSMDKVAEGMGLDEETINDIDITISDAIAMGSSTAALSVSFAEDTWNALLDFVSELAQYGTTFGGVSDEFVYPVTFSDIQELGSFLGIEFYSSLSDDFDTILSKSFLSVFSCSYNGVAAYLIMSCDEPVTYDFVTDTNGYISFYVYHDSEPLIVNTYTEKSYGWYYVKKPLASTSGYFTYSAGSNSYAVTSSYTTVNLWTDIAPILVNSNAATESLGLISDVFYAELAERVYDVVTPHRVLTDEGAITGNVTLTIPQALDVADAIAAVKEGTLPVTDVLEVVGVIPIDMTSSRAIADADEKTAAEALEAVESVTEYNQYTVDLTGIFPFCIPFDLIRFLNVLDADPVAPCFEIPFVVDALDIDIIIEFDMSFLDDAVSVLRAGELGCFIISLMMITSKVIRW